MHNQCENNSDTCSGGQLSGQDSKRATEIGLIVWSARWAMQLEEYECIVILQHSSPVFGVQPDEVHLGRVLVFKEGARNRSRSSKTHRERVAFRFFSRDLALMFAFLVMLCKLFLPSISLRYVFSTL
jgi:hypothetical protein